MDEFCNQITALIKASGGRDAAWQGVLGLMLARFNSETGTIHLLDQEQQLLHLAAQKGVPPPVLEHVRLIPVGKGIAGQTVVRDGPVTMCNLQTDSGGVARPSARQTGVGGALCVPMRDGATIVGTIGVGTRREYEYTQEERDLLEEIGRSIGKYATGN